MRTCDLGLQLAAERWYGEYLGVSMNCLQGAIVLNPSARYRVCGCIKQRIPEEELCCNVLFCFFSLQRRHLNVLPQFNRILSDMLVSGSTGRELRADVEA